MRCKEDRTLRAVLVGMLREAGRYGRAHAEELKDGQPRRRSLRRVIPFGSGHVGRPGPALLTVADCNAPRVKRLREAKKEYVLLA